jgi:hypothetical protein
VSDELSDRLAEFARELRPLARAAPAATVRARGDRRRAVGLVSGGVAAIVVLVLVLGGAALVTGGLKAPGRVVAPAVSGPVDPGPAVTGSPSPAPPASAGAANPPAPPRDCPAFPAFPDSGCTGWRHTGAALHGCGTVLSTPNSTYDSCLFNGTVTVRARNVSITRSRVVGRVDTDTGTGDLQGLKLLDVEIDGNGVVDDGRAAIGHSNFTCTRCDIHGTVRGVTLGANVTVQDSYLHDFVTVPSGEYAMSSAGGSGFRIFHNNLQCNSSQGSGCGSALALFGDFTAIHDVLVQSNLFNAESSYCTYAGSAVGKRYPHGTDIRYLDNRFGKKYAVRCGADGPVTAWEPNAGNRWTGNLWEDGSGPVVP